MIPNAYWIMKILWGEDPEDVSLTAAEKGAFCEAALEILALPIPKWEDPGEVSGEITV